MGIRFESIVVGGTVLIRDAIQSSNYVAGVSGWRINSDGSAEFNNISIIGQFETIGSDVRTAINSGGIFQSVRSTGTNSTATIFSMYPRNPTDLGVAISLPATLAALTDTSSGERAFVQLISPGFAAKARASISLTCQTTGSASDNTQIFMTASAATQSGNFNVGGTQRLGPNQQEIGQGVIAGAHALATSAAIGAVETVTLTSNSATWRAGHTYRISVYGGAGTSVVGLANNPVLRVRKTNAAGLLLGSGVVYCPVVAPTSFNAAFTAIFDVGAADVTAAIALTIQGAAGFNATHTATPGRGFYIEDIGSAANPALDSANVVTLT